MATVNFIRSRGQSRGSLQGVLDYVRQDEKCISDGVRFVTGKDCCAETAYAEFMATKNSYSKANGVFFYHYTQSFSPEENITPAQAHQAALKLAEHYDGFEVLITTHCDAEHIHSHLVINSVSFADGKKLRQDPRTLERLRHISDEICSEMGLSTLEPYEQKPQAKTISTREFRAAEKGESWKFRLMGEIDQAMQTAQSSEDFIAMMKKRGYGVRWEAGRKSITYTTPDNKKCRDNKLHETKYLKERMELEFGLRATQAQKQQKHAGSRTAIPADSLRDPETAMGSYADPDERELALHGRYGDRQEYGVLLPGDQQNPGSADGQPGQSPAGDDLTGWEDARRIFQANQKSGIFINGLAETISEENLAARDYPDWSTDDYPEPVDDLADMDYEVTQWQMRF